MTWRRPTPERTRVRIPQGPPGPRGPQGPQGPPGPAADAVIFYRHVQSSPASSWTIPHNLGYRPGGITVYDSAHIEREGTVTHLDDNTVRIDFVAAGAPVAFSGEAYLS